MNKALRISISYSARQANSYLDGSNDAPLPKKGRGYKGAIQSLKEDVNSRSIEMNTVLGALSRLIGDQRKLYEALNSDDFYFRDVQDAITFEDVESCSTDTINFLTNKRKVKAGASGLVDDNSIFFTLEGVDKLWSILFVEPEEILSCLKSSSWNEYDGDFGFEMIAERMSELSKLKKVKLTETEFVAYYTQVVSEVANISHLPETTYMQTTEEEIKLKLGSLYCSMLYYAIDKLRADIDIDQILTERGKISGFALSGFTEKDFLARQRTGQTRFLMGNPTLVKKNVQFLAPKGKSKKPVKQSVSENVPVLTEKDGVLNIYIDIDRKRANEIMNAINAASVSTFRLGRKGISYVREMKYGKVLPRCFR